MVYLDETPDDTNLLLTHKGINYLFETTNLQLERISQWFSNKLSLSLSKTKCLFFHERAKGKRFHSFY